MKKKLLFLLTMICMLLLTACRIHDTMQIRVYFLPDCTTAYLLLKTDGEALRDIPEKELPNTPQWQYKEDGYVYAARLPHMMGMSQVKNNQPQETTAPALTVYADSEEEFAAFCEKYQTCKILFYREDSGEVWASSAFSLTPTDKFGYPSLVDYDCEQDSFTSREWILRPVMGHSLHWWQDSLLRFGYFGTAVAVIAVGIMAIVSVCGKKAFPWVAMWVTAVAFCLPHILATVLCVILRTVPYFRTTSDTVSLKDIAAQTLFDGFPWVLLLAVLAILHVISASKRKKTGDRKSRK